MSAVSIDSSQIAAILAGKTVLVIFSCVVQSAAILQLARLRVLHRPA